MVAAAGLVVGDVVKDKKLGMAWTVVGRDNSRIFIRRNGVTAAAEAADLQLLHAGPRCVSQVCLEV